MDLRADSCPTWLAPLSTSSPTRTWSSAATDMRQALHSDQRSQAIVEFAIVAPVLLLLIFGVVDFGRVIYVYATINQGVNEGARSAIRASPLQVTIRYNFVPFTPLIQQVTANHIVISASATYKTEY